MIRRPFSRAADPWSPAVDQEVGGASVGDAVAALTAAPDADDAGAEPGPDRKERARQVAGLALALARSGRAAGGAAVVKGRWLVDVLLDVAPRIAVRDLDALQAAHGGLQGDLLAEALVSSASHASAAVGAAGGAVAAVEWAAPPSVLVSGPFQIAAETLAVAAIEIKLIAELHVVYGAVPAGNPRQRAMSYVWAWTTRRGVDPTDPGGISRMITGPARRSIRNRLAGRAARNLGTMGPLLTGVLIGSMTNSRETTALGKSVSEDLRDRWTAERPRVGR